MQAKPRSAFRGPRVTFRGVIFSLLATFAILGLYQRWQEVVLKREAICQETARLRQILEGKAAEQRRLKREYDFLSTDEALVAAARKQGWTRPGEVRLILTTSEQP